MRLLRNIQTNNGRFLLRALLITGTASVLALGSVTTSAQQYIAERLLDPAEVERIVGPARESAEPDRERTVEQPQERKGGDSPEQDQQT